MEYFDIDLSYRVEATFKPHPEPMKLKIPNAIGEYDEETSYGTLHFTLKGQECSLLSLENPKEKLWLIFRDQSTNKVRHPLALLTWHRKHMVGVASCGQQDLLMRTIQPP